MKQLVELPVGSADGLAHTVQVEIEQSAEGLVEVSRPGQVAARAKHSLGEMLAGIRPAAESFLDGFSGMTHPPEEISLEFGLSLAADANLVVATSSAQANFKVTLTWKALPEPGPGTSSPALKP